MTVFRHQPPSLTRRARDMHQPVKTPARMAGPSTTTSTTPMPPKLASTTIWMPQNNTRATAAVSRSRGIFVPQPGRTPSTPGRCPAAHSRNTKK